MTAGTYRETICQVRRTGFLSHHDRVFVHVYPNVSDTLSHGRLLSYAALTSPRQPATLRSRAGRAIGSITILGRVQSRLIAAAKVPPPGGGRLGGGEARCRWRCVLDLGRCELSPSHLSRHQAQAYMLLLCCPPTSQRAWVIRPREQEQTVSSRSTNSPDQAAVRAQIS